MATVAQPKLASERMLDLIIETVRQHTMAPRNDGIVSQAWVDGYNEHVLQMTKLLISLKGRAL